MAAQNWVMIISEQHRYQGVSYKSDIIVISGEGQDKRNLTSGTHPLVVIVRTWPGGQTGSGAEIRWVWPAVSAGQLGWKVRDNQTMTVIDIMSVYTDLSSRGLITTPWMWWMSWCWGEVTRWRETRSRGRCPASTTRMTSARGLWHIYHWLFTFLLWSYILENAHNLRTSSTRVTKELAKSLIRKDSDMSNYHQK